MPSTESSETSDDRECSGAMTFPNDDFLFDALEMIRVKRWNEREHTAEELAWWIQQFTHDKIPIYQMSAWLMSVCFNGLSVKETTLLTKCMVDSGLQLQWRNTNNYTTTSIPTTVPATSAFDTKNQNSFYMVDKHSTGGVGDKVSIVLAPLVVAMGRGKIKVPMMAGRGLGHTGGTIDKLESIPGFNATLTATDFQKIVLETGCAITAASSEICPADQKLYALRDVTETVSSIPLQTASIMSKKIAENPDSIVLDVKYGNGSFQSDIEKAKELAISMIRTGEGAGLQPTTAFLTRMDAPIGCAVGNWVEILECIKIMTPSFYNTTADNNKEQRQRLSNDLIQLIIVQAAQMVLQSGTAETSETFEGMIQKAFEVLKSGDALKLFRMMVVEQGGDPTITVDNPDRYPLPPPVEAVTWISLQSGYISSIHAKTVGQACVLLGAGRQEEGQSVDPYAGIWFYYKVGDYIQQGDKIADLYTSKNSPKVLHHVVERLQSAITYSDVPVPVSPIVTHRVTSQNGVEKLSISDILNL